MPVTTIGSCHRTYARAALVSRVDLVDRSPDSFSSEPMNSKVLQECLRRLLPHVDTGRIALTGSVAIEMHNEVKRCDGIRRLDAEDIDFVADEAKAVRQTVTSDFLVSHFHMPQPGYPKFLIQLVDPATRLRIDVFQDSLLALSRAKVLNVAGIPLHVLKAQDVLAHKLALMSKASVANPVDKKHYEDAKRLGAIWAKNVPLLPASHIGSTVYSQDTETKCPRCEISRCIDFPLAPKTSILDILGYV
jgi:hypothetical protein